MISQRFRLSQEFVMNKSNIDMNHDKKMEEKCLDHLKKGSLTENQF